MWVLSCQDQTMEISFWGTQRVKWLKDEEQFLKVEKKILSSHLRSTARKSSNDIPSTSMDPMDQKAQTLSNAPSFLMALRANLCHECGKSFESTSALKTHRKSHSVQWLYGCSTCGKQYTRKKELSLHQRLHTNESLLYCAYCKRKFTRKRDLICHEKSHTGEKPFPCTLCGTSFSRRSTLKLHIQRHKGIKL